METIKTQRLSKRFLGVPRLGPLDLRVSAGEILGVVGPKGAGKTTLLRLIWGFLRPDEGSVSVFGLHPHMDQIKIRLRSGYVPKDPHFYSSLTARQTLRFIGHFYTGWDDEHTGRLLDQFGMDPNTPIQPFSASDRTRLSIIAALGHRPSLLILDEPGESLDHRTRSKTLKFLKRLACEEQVSIVVSSDISDDLDHISDTILMLDRGRMIEYAPAAALLDKYGEPRLEAIFANAAGGRGNA